MSASTPILIWSVVLSVAFGTLTAASAASDHQNQYKYGTQGQSSAVRHSSVHHAAPTARPTAAISNPKPNVNAAAGAANGSAVDRQTALDALAVQHKDKDWKGNHESWCDVDPKCSGWNKNMQTYEQTFK